MANGDVPGTCGLCSAKVEDITTHLQWHLVNKLHGWGCDIPRINDMQSRTGAYITRKPCSCGLAEFEAGLVKQNGERTVLW